MGLNLSNGYNVSEHACYSTSGGPLNTDCSATLTLALYFIWYVFAIVQSFLAYGTAYRKTKATGDNGAPLFGWMLLHILAALVLYMPRLCTRQTEVIKNRRGWSRTNSGTSPLNAALPMPPRSWGKVQSPLDVQVGDLRAGVAAGGVDAAMRPKVTQRPWPMPGT